MLHRFDYKNAFFENSKLPPSKTYGNKWIK